MKYRLGIDVGTNSLGWAALGLDDHEVPICLVDAGARIFSEGRDAKTKSTLKASRTEKRSARRRRDRFLQRQKFLISELVEFKLFPADIDERKQLEAQDPYALRHRGLLEKLDLHQIGRALFHLNQRRGFKSNRKDKSEESTSGVVSKSVRALLQEMKLMAAELSEDDFKALSKEEKKALRVEEATNRKLAIENLAAQPNVSFGSFLHQRRQKGQTVRARRQADGKLYDVYPTRELLEDEFTKILAKQAAYYPDVITPEVRERLRIIIFTQRELKEQKRGLCSFYAEEKRTFRCMPGFQRYRMVQDLHALEWTDTNGKHCLRDYPDARDEILAKMEGVTSKKGEFTFGNMKKILKKHGLVVGDTRFNFENPKRKGFEGNMTSRIMQHEELVGAQWYDWPLEKQDRLIDIVNDGTLIDEEVLGYLQNEFGLCEFNAQNTMNAHLFEGTASVSQKAALKLYHHMLAHNCLQSDAVQACAEEDEAFANPFTRQGSGELLDALPYYGEAFQDGRHIIPGDRDPKDSHDAAKYYGAVSNPTVHIALNQIRQVVNELIERLGNPTSISIELARNLPEGEIGRKKIEKEQADNQVANGDIDEELEKLGQNPSRENRLRLALWKQLSTDPNSRFCPFTGEKITMSDLFNGAAEIEHLIPFSQSLDDSKANKVICTRKANRDKRNQTPFQAFGHSPNGYDWQAIQERANDLPQSKRWRFQEDAMEIWLRDHSDFSGRHLNDTRYIGRLTREYLEAVCPHNKIDVVTGRLTALLRGHWGLNSILRGHNAPETEKNKKLRDDHRHHAIDAIVIGMTTRSMLQRVSTAAGRAEELDIARLFVTNDAGHSAIEPWDGFRDEVGEKVRSVIVSHKVKRKTRGHGATDGQLHNETAYGIVSGPDEEGGYEVTVRKPVGYFDTKKRIEIIRDATIQAAFLDAFEAAPDAKSAKQAVLQRASEMGVKSVRTLEVKKIVPIADKSGKAYKAYAPDGNWGMEIFEYPSGHKNAGEWESVIITRFEANQPSFKPGETKRPHPAAKLVMRFQINDLVEVTIDGEPTIYRVQKMSAGMLVCAPPNEANVDARKRDKEDAFQYKEFNARRLKKSKARKLHISPSGRINYSKGK